MSILEPNVWNIFYVEVLRRKMVGGVAFIGYEDDVAVTIITRDVDAGEM